MIAVFLAILASRNWHDVTLNLWGDIQADIKLPILLGIVLPDRMAADLPHPRAPGCGARSGASTALERQQAAARAAPSAAADRSRARPHEPDLRCASTRPTSSARTRMAEQVRGNAGGVKLGLEFFSANGPAACAAHPRARTCRSSSTSSCTTFPTPSPRRSRRCAARAGRPDRPCRRRAGDARGRQGRCPDRRPRSSQ